MKSKKIRNRILLILALWFLYYFLNSSWALYKLYKKKKALETKVVELKAKENYLLSKMELLNDPLWVEYIARERLGMIMPNEKPIRIIVVKDIAPKKKKQEH